MVAALLTVTDDQREELTRIAVSSVLPHAGSCGVVGVRGVANEEIARRSQVDSDTVRRWRKRFTDKGIEGVGSRRADRVQRVIELTLTGQPPGGATH